MLFDGNDPMPEHWENERGYRNLFNERPRGTLPDGTPTVNPLEIIPAVTQHNRNCATWELHAPHHWAYGTVYYLCLGKSPLIP